MELSQIWADLIYQSKPINNNIILIVAKICFGCKLQNFKRSTWLHNVRVINWSVSGQSCQVTTNSSLCQLYLSLCKEKTRRFLYRIIKILLILYSYELDTLVCSMASMLLEIIGHNHSFRLLINDKENGRYCIKKY